MSELERLRAELAEEQELADLENRLAKNALSYIRAKIPEPTPQEIEARKLMSSPAIRRGMFYIRVAKAAKKRHREESKLRRPGAMRSFRGTYDEDANITCQYQYLDLDPDARPRGHATFDADSGRFVKVREPSEHVVDRVSKHESIDPRKIRRVQRDARNPIAHADTKILRGLGTSVPKLFVGTEGPRSGPYFRYGKGRAPGTEPPAYDSPWYKRGIGPDPDDGSHLRRSNRQEHDFRDYGNVKDRLRGFDND